MDRKQTYKKGQLRGQILTLGICNLHKCQDLSKTIPNIPHFAYLTLKIAEIAMDRARTYKKGQLRGQVLTLGICNLHKCQDLSKTIPNIPHFAYLTLQIAEI